MKWHDVSEQPLTSSGVRGRGGPQIVRYLLVATATLAASLLIQVVWAYTQTPGRGRAAPPASQAVETPRVMTTPLSASIATLTQLADCIWEEPAARRVGSRLPASRLRLRSGIARVRIDGGPDLVIEGPADLRLDSAMAATFHGARSSSWPMKRRRLRAARPHRPLSWISGPNMLSRSALRVRKSTSSPEKCDALPGPARADPEHLTAGEARRYAGSPASAGRPTVLDPARFIRQVANPVQPIADSAAGLLAYESFADEPRGIPGRPGQWRLGLDQSVDARFCQAVSRDQASRPACAQRQ